ncbi:MAG: DNA primase [Clostridia bacterium]|nr:DNA primase [Clostridia bacterium]
MAFPQNFIMELKSRANLVDLISSVTELKRAGSNLVGRCPFHNERTGSFTVFNSSDPSAAHYYCFGCGEGGDAITFVMKTENLDYPAAVEALANRVGMKVPEERRFGEKKLDRARLYELNAAAARFFHETLIGEKGKIGLDYLMNKRGLSMGVIRHFGLGFAPQSWNELTDAMKKKGFTEDELVSVFLAGRKGERVFDMFRGRVMFPIIDLSGHIIAFGGRVMDNSTPKYLNSSDTAVFKKRMNLYALNFAKSTTRDALIFCEGYMDVIALHRAGFTNAVATLGTAITPEQARLVRRYVKKVYLCYDSDDAGQRATAKAIELLEAADVQVRVITVKGAKDPDEFITKFGADAFEKLLADADGHIEYAFRKLARDFNLDVPEERLRFARAACEMLCGNFSALEREVYLSRLAELTKIDLAVLRNQLSSILKGRERAVKKREQTQVLQKLSGYGDRVNPDRQKYPAAAIIEEQILGILFLHPEFLADAQVAGVLSAETFLCAVHSRAFAAMKDVYAQSDLLDIALLSAVLSPEEVSLIMGAKLLREKLTDNSKAVLLDLVGRLGELKDKETAPSGDLAADIEKIRQRKLKKERQ